MAALNGTNVANSLSIPRGQSLAGEVGGIKRILLDSYVGTPVAADTLAIGNLPKGARLLDIKTIGMGGAGLSFNVAIGSIMSAVTAVVVTVGAAPSANPIAWCEYIVD